jgi:Domain of unknown function (DUF4279)
MTRANEFKVYFTLVGDFNPADITHQIGVEPTESWKKGDRNEKTHLERKFSRWSLESRLESLEPVVEHIRDVLKQLEPHIEMVKAVRSNFDGGMQIVAHFHSDAPGFHFDEDVIAGCAAMNLSIDCDFYTLYSDKREDS